VRPLQAGSIRYLGNAAPDQAKVLLGVDGGGTHTRARVVTAQGRALGEGRAGPSGLSLGLDAAWTNVRLAIDNAFEAASVQPPKPSEMAVGIGVAGATSPSLLDGFAVRCRDWGRCTLSDDAVIAHLGAFGHAPGLLVIAGTGSIAVARDRQGRLSQNGGWGYPLGDEGSGAWIGAQALRRLFCGIDHRGTSTSLVERMMRAVGSDYARVVEWVRLSNQSAVARLAPLVFEAAEAGDSDALAILKHAADAVEQLVDNGSDDPSLPVCLAGTVAQRLTARLSPPLQERLVEAAGDSLAGALQLARASRA
jgi:glucosamine kinase